MKIFKYPRKTKQTLLALGSESAGNFSLFHKGKLYFSRNFGDLLEEANFFAYKNELNKFLRKNRIKPDVILADLHPLYRTTALGEELSKKYKAEHAKIQHHIAHIFSAIGDETLNSGKTGKTKRFKNYYGIAMDGTGYGTDGRIWGGEVFHLQTARRRLQINRIGRLENQILIGGDLAVREPARVLLAILSKHLDKISLCGYMETFYASDEFEVLYNQLRHNFNCQETSSTGRILDAVSVLLGFAKNKRTRKHEAAYLLENNSGKPYANLKPEVIYDRKEKLHVLQTTPLFEYLIKNIRKDRKRLAATAQLYIARGLYEIIKKSGYPMSKKIFLAGGIGNNKIISSYLESKGACKNTVAPRGDAGISFGQIFYHLLNFVNRSSVSVSLSAFRSVSGCLDLF